MPNSEALSMSPSPVEDPNLSRANRDLDNSQLTRSKMEGVFSGMVEIPEDAARQVDEAITNKSAEATEAHDAVSSAWQAWKQGGHVPREFTAQAREEILEQLPEPSLAGMVTAQEQAATDMQSLGMLGEIDAGGNEQAPLAERYQAELGSAIQEAQALFYERIDSPNSLYWHFTSRGLKIIRDGELKSQAGGADQNTGDGSAGTHFVKPGLGIHTTLGYHDFAKRMKRDPEDTTPPLGMAVVYRLGDIIETTPYRDEPVEHFEYKGASVSQDVTFRDADESARYAYPLDNAYIVPFASSEQLAALKADPTYESYFRGEHSDAIDAVYSVTVGEMLKAGYDQDWVQKHVVNPKGLVDPRMITQTTGELSAVDIAEGYDYDRDEGKPSPQDLMEQDMYRQVGNVIRQGLGDDTEIVVPLTAKKGNYEHHDNADPDAQYWQEKLVRLKLKT